MRYIIYGAGAIGGGIGARLFQHGHEVVLIGRGAHLQAMQEKGLRLRTPDEDVTLPVPAVGHPRDIDFRPDDVVLLTMKTQDTEQALADLAACAGTDIPVICCQNGVENERMALRRFAKVYAMLVAMPATFLVPGEVEAEGVPMTGVLDCGVYPAGVDATIEQVAAGISSSKMSAYADPAVMRLKYTKLFANLGNALQIVTGAYRGSDTHARLLRRLKQEAEDCFRAAGIGFIPESEYNEFVRSRCSVGRIPGGQRAGSSTWQGLMRGNTSIEADYLNGEVALLGRLHGVPTPLNAVIQRLANQIAASGKVMGDYSAEQVEEMANKA